MATTPAGRHSISTARKDLPRLFTRVIRRQGEKVVIARRGTMEEAVLVSRSYLDRLEAAGRPPVKPFRIMGSARLVGSVDEIIGSIRATERRVDEARIRSFSDPRRG